eukprot:EC834168.1.p3 GENE.EC834168.1~~EC834168.1.p3  ORF type:complete len:76 (+),score=7.19 EC834168.1:194-421(+)
MACVRYVAHKYGLVPADPVQAGRCDMICEAVEDLMGQFYKANMGAATDADKTKFRTETLPAWLTHFDKSWERSLT